MFSFRHMHLLSLATAMLLCLTTNRQNFANAHYSLRPAHQTTAEDESNVGSEEPMVLVHRERYLPSLCTEQLDDFQPFDDDKDHTEVDIDITLTLNDSSEKTQRKAIKQTKKALQKAMHHIMTTNAFEKNSDDLGLRLDVERHNIAVSSPAGDEEDLSFTMRFSFPSLTGELNYNCHDGITYAKEKITRALYRAFAGSSGSKKGLEKAFKHKLKVTDNFTFAKLEVWVSMA
jgi:hypothetical protein